jgi:hypothetical protein
MRDLLLRGFVLCGASLALLTEFLSLFHMLRPIPLAAAWLVLAFAAARYLYQQPPRFPHPERQPLAAAAALLIAAIAAIIGATALLSPPNSADAMAYHMPRVVYWAQSGSVAFFPTAYFNQICLQPLAEYAMLHTYLLSGGDHFINLVAFAAWLGSVAGVSAIAATAGLGARGQAFAAVFCATLPNGILQASGAKNDWLLAFWLVAMVYFGARRDFPFMGLAAALALATKATAYLFAPPLLAVLLARHKSPGRRAWIILATAILLIDGPQYWRNYRLSGSPLGYDSAQGDGVFRWRNEHPGWKSTVSNALRHLSEQLGGRSPRWNQAVFNTTIRIHSALDLDPQDPSTTWPGSRYAAPVNANHEANANNRWHLLIFVLAGIYALIAQRTRWIAAIAALAISFLLFCFYLKWQPFLARLELPLFVLSAVPAAYLLESLRPAWLGPLVCGFLLTTARLPLLLNWTRPLEGPRSILTTRRDDNYFADMSQWHNRASYLESADRTARSGCRQVGIDISENQLEYPYQALLRERDPAVRFQHTGVTNSSARYQPPGLPQPCAVLCLDCIANREKIALYEPIGPPVTIGRFLLFLAR